MTQFQRGNARASKLNNLDVLEMRQKYFDEGWTQAQCARHWHVNVNTVGRIVRGESRQAVPMPSDDPAAVQRRLMELSERINAESLAKLTTAIAQDPATKSRIEEEKFIDWTEASKYGVIKS